MSIGSIDSAYLEHGMTLQNLRMEPIIQGFGLTESKETALGTQSV
jgi:hypothetical protein